MQKVNFLCFQNVDMTKYCFSPNNVLLQSPEEVFMEIRRPLEWHCKQMDHFVGLNFSANFNFALVGHLLKGKVTRYT